jgi:phosphoribosylformylglycinamidine synthase subunit PurS
MEFQIEIRVVPREGILDPQGKAVHGALANLGFNDVGEVHVGRLIRIGLRAPSAEAAAEAGITMCRQLLANPVTEDFDVRVVESAEATR